MLFDLRGNRRRLVQVVYSLLAASFLIGFVFLGIGTGGIGSVSDLFGGGDGGSTSSQFDSQISSAQAELQKDPKDTAALLKLAENEWFKAKSGVSQDPSTGQITGISDDAHTALGQSADAWAKYLKVNKGKPDSGVANEMTQVYVLLNDAPGAAKAQQIVAEDQPNQNTYGTLALYLYAGNDIAGGDAAAKKAVSLAPKSTQKQVKQQLDQTRAQAVKAKQQQAKAQKKAQQSTTPSGAPLQSPFGSLPNSGP
ncbi:MAG TPA: hypothetical protein VH391_02920 [Solirubrobacterales bacterium]